MLFICSTAVLRLIGDTVSLLQQFAIGNISEAMVFTLERAEKYEFRGFFFVRTKKVLRG